jgi:hypothetical protein
MPCVSHPPWPSYSNYIWRRVQVMNLLVTQFSPVSYSVTSLGCKYSPQYLVLKNLLPAFFSWCQKRNIIPVQNYGEIIVLHILIFTIVDSRREDEMFELNGSKHYRNLIRFYISHVQNIDYFLVPRHGFRVFKLRAVKWADYFLAGCQLLFLTLHCKKLMFMVCILLYILR